MRWLQVVPVLIWTLVIRVLIESFLGENTVTAPRWGKV
jgi:hypothetical protein